MEDDYSCVGVPATTQELEVIAKEHHEHPAASSKTQTLVEPQLEAPTAPKLTAPRFVSPSLLSIAQNLTSWS